MLLGPISSILLSNIVNIRDYSIVKYKPIILFIRSYIVLSTIIIALSYACVLKTG